MGLQFSSPQKKGIEKSDKGKRSISVIFVVSGEVGLGVVPDSLLGRQIRDLHGWANQRLADKADEVIWMVAGIPIPIGQYRLKE